jgi:hypothetical protein
MISNSITDLSARVLGKTTYGWWKYTEGIRCAVCLVDKHIPAGLKGEGLTFRSVLWHEYCHAETWIVEGTPSGHGVKFLRKMVRKPILAAWSMTIAHIMYFWWRRS